MDSESVALTAAGSGRFTSERSLTMKWLVYPLFALQARMYHRRWHVSAEYMELILRIEWHRKHEHWDEGRYELEMMSLARRFPHDFQTHMQLLGDNNT